MEKSDICVLKDGKIVMDQYIKLAEAYGSEVFDVLYPAGNSNGNDLSRRYTIQMMLGLKTDGGERGPLPKSGYTGEFYWKNYVLRWNYPHKWIELYRVVNVKKRSKTDDPVVAIGNGE